MKNENIELIVKETTDFLVYVDSFYGKGGLYAKKDFATFQQICEACKTYIGRLNEDMTWGGGDTLDRERVAAILIDEMNVNLY